MAIGIKPRSFLLRASNALNALYFVCLVLWCLLPSVSNINIVWIYGLCSNHTENTFKLYVSV